MPVHSQPSHLLRSPRGRGAGGRGGLRAATSLHVTRAIPGGPEAPREGTDGGGGVCSCQPFPLTSPPRPGGDRWAALGGQDAHECPVHHCLPSPRCSDHHPRGGRPEVLPADQGVPGSAARLCPASGAGRGDAGRREGGPGECSARGLLPRALLWRDAATSPAFDTGGDLAGDGDTTNPPCGDIPACGKPSGKSFPPRWDSGGRQQERCRCLTPVTRAVCGQEELPIRGNSKRGDVATFRRLPLQVEKPSRSSPRNPGGLQGARSPPGARVRAGHPGRGRSRPGAGLSSAEP